jgi:hypothetical protein
MFDCKDATFIKIINILLAILMNNTENNLNPKREFSSRLYSSGNQTGLYHYLGGGGAKKQGGGKGRWRWVPSSPLFAYLLLK